MSLKIALVLASVLSTADFLKCYICAGDQCTDNPTTCPQGSDRCMKSNSPLGTVKACGLQAACDVAPQQIHCCKEDLCNGAGTTGKNLLLLLVPVASIFLLS